jgi:nicotinamide riboside kinase
MPAKRIALIGAESTGKSTLARTLALELRAALVPEVLRAWCDERGRTPRRDEQRAIFDAQLKQENEMAAAHDIIVCDTTPLTIALASVHYFDDAWLLANALHHQRGYAVTLLCMPDIEWVADGIQRDGPQVRAAIHALTQNTLDANGIAHTRVTGEGAGRIARAVAAVQWLIES